MNYEDLLKHLLASEERKNTWLRKEHADIPSRFTFLTGHTQFFVLDQNSENAGDVPVVVCLGINYSQHPQKANCDFSEYEDNCQARLGGMRRHLDRALNDFNTHQPLWAQSGKCSEGIQISQLHGNRYHLIAANFCPFITTRRWQDCPPDERRTLLERTGSSFLEELLQENLQTCLWVSHGLHPEVQQLFDRFRTTLGSSLRNWLRTPNLSCLYDYDNGPFRNSAEPAEAA